MILRRLPDSLFSEVARAWSGETVVILGGGPSLSRDYLDQVSAAHGTGRVRCIAVNDLYLLAPWADVHYAADSQWHAWHTQGIEKPKLSLSAAEVCERWAAFAGQKCSIQVSGTGITDERVHILRNAHHPDRHSGLSSDPRVLVTGWHSGFQALNLAILAGAETVILCGYDGREPSMEHAAHGLCGEHPRPTPPQVYELYRKAYSAAEHLIEQAGVRVLNASPGSAINSFPHVTLADALVETVAA